MWGQLFSLKIFCVFRHMFPKEGRKRKERKRVIVECQVFVSLIFSLWGGKSHGHRLSFLCGSRGWVLLNMSLSEGVACCCESC